MEQHPVPQNVTTFQFRLIGDMTIKQFGYLCAGAILAFIAYKLPLPFIITWPLTGAFAFLGVGFAFIPIEERPMDVWVFSFFKSIYSPTQYIWSHESTTPTPKTQAAPKAVPSPTVATTAVPVATPTQPTPPSAIPPQAHPQTSKSVLSGLFQTPTPATPQPAQQDRVRVAKPHVSILDEIALFFRPKHTPSSVAVQSDTQQIPPVTGKHADIDPKPQSPPTSTLEASQMQQKMKQLEETLATLETRLATKSMTEDRVLELQKQLTDVMVAKNKTEEELVTLKRKMTPDAPPVASQNAPTLGRGTVNVITTQEAAVKVGLPRLTNVPNVITGLVKDDAGNLLPGILVTVTNHEGVPVRALKTNKLGQFAASTQLMSGVYFVEIEDPRGRFSFTRVQITLNGSVVPVLEIIARSEKALTREKLAQEIFGKTSI